MLIEEIQSLNDSLYVQIYNVNGTERFVLKDDKTVFREQF
jgi:hypothetical protein